MSGTLSICYMLSILTIDKYDILRIMAAIFVPTWCKQTINGIYSQLFFDGVHTQLAVQRLGDVALDARSERGIFQNPLRGFVLGKRFLQLLTQERGGLVDKNGQKNHVKM